MEKKISLIPAKNQGQWGYLNTSGEWAISPRFDAAWDFEECGVARVALNNKVRIIDTSGKFVRNCSFDALTDFGRHRVARAEKNGKWSIIGTDGKHLLQQKFDKINAFYYNGIFN